MEIRPLYKQRCNYPKDLRDKQVQMIRELQKNNIVYTGNPKIIRSFACQLRTAKDKGYILFSWNKQWKKSIMSLSPNVKLVEPKMTFKYGLHIYRK